MNNQNNDSNTHNDKDHMLDGFAQNPQKTIVGGRPDSSGRVINGLPSGIQKLIISASLNDEIKASVLDNAAKAAKDLNIELSDSESSILSSVPVKQLKTMIEGMEKNPNIHRRDFLFKSAAVIAAAAVSTLGITACASQYPVTKGISPDIPDNNHITTRGIDLDVPSITWYNSIDLAFKDARKNKQPLMIVFLHSQDYKQKHPPTEAEVHSEKICEFGSTDLRKKIFRYRFIPVRISDEKIAAAYKTNIFPSVLFLSADRKELGKVSKPKDDDEISGILQKIFTEYEKIKNK